MRSAITVSIDGVADMPMGAFHSSVTMRRRSRSKLMGRRSKLMSSLLVLESETTALRRYRDLAVCLNVLLSIHVLTHRTIGILPEGSATSPNVKDRIKSIVL